VAKARAPGRLRQLAATLAGAIRLTREASPAAFWINVTISALTAVMPPLTVWLGKHLVDLVVRGQSRGGVSSADMVPTVIGLGATAAALRALSAVQAHRQTHFASIVELHAERRLLEKVAAADLGYFDDPGWHDRAARATRELSWRPYTLACTLVSLAGSLVTLAGMLVLLGALSPWLVVLALASVVPTAMTQRRVTRELHELWHVTTPEERQRHYLRSVLSQAEAAKEVRAFGLADHLLRRHAEVSGHRLAAMRRLHARADRNVVLSAAAAGAALGGSYWLVATRGLAGSFTPGDLTLVIGAFAAVTAQLGALLGSFLQLDQNAAFLADYFSFLELEPLLPVPARPTPLPTDLGDGIRLEAVTFTYPTGTAPILRDVDLNVAPGELLALVGANGAGKTSIVKLLLRFYDPDAGTVRIGGVDVRELDPVELRQRIGVLFQDFEHYELSARDNVVLGRTDGTADDNEVWNALNAAEAEELVLGLPHGLDSHVGRLFSGGHDLSGGEWQRLALARLLFRNADIWIFDEPASALDAEVEAAVFANLRALLEGRIGIVISHRFSTVRSADRIAVIGDGHIVELGSHEELMEVGGAYARLFNLQAAGYR